MDIEKVKNYNQKMLAIIVSAGVLMAFIGLLALIFFIGDEVIRTFRNRNTYNNQEVIASQSDIYDNDNNSDTANPSFNLPELIDSVRQIYIIPVKQTSAYEITDNNSKKLLFSRQHSSYKYRNYNDYNQVNYVNMIIFDAKSGKKEILFRQNLVIGNYGANDVNNDVLLLMEIALSDTNKDGRIGINDETSLFIYSTQNQTIREIKYKGKSVLNFQNIPNTRDYMVKFGSDPSKINKTEEKNNTAVLCRYIYDQDKLENIYDENVAKELNDILKKK